VESDARIQNKAFGERGKSYTGIKMKWACWRVGPERSGGMGLGAKDDEAWGPARSSPKGKNAISLVAEPSLPLGWKKEKHMVRRVAKKGTNLKQAEKNARTAQGYFFLQCCGMVLFWVKKAEECPRKRTPPSIVEGEISPCEKKGRRLIWKSHVTVLDGGRRKAEGRASKGLGGFNRIGLGAPRPSPRRVAHKGMAGRGRKKKSLTVSQRAITVSPYVLELVRGLSEEERGRKGGKTSIRAFFIGQERKFKKGIRQGSKDLWGKLVGSGKGYVGGGEPVENRRSFSIRA